MFNLQPTLSNTIIKIQPLVEKDFEALFKVASDPLVWEQHPNKDRHKREIFQNFFKGAIESKGAFIVRDAIADDVIGSSRFYDYDKSQNIILIGYTFLARDHWGTTYNRALKTLMLNHAFIYVDKVHFHIGAQNIRSQNAIQKLGAIKLKEIEVAYYGEPEKLNFVYEISKSNWESKSILDQNKS